MAFDPNVGLGGNALLTPSSTKQIAGTNYIPRNYFADGVTKVGGTGTDSSTFLPDLMEKEVARFGPEGLAGILDRLGGKIPFTNSEIKWSEKARLHTLYNNVTLGTGTSNVFTVRAQDGARGAAAQDHIFRVGQTIHVQDGNGAEEKGVITAVSAQTFTALSYNNTNWDIARVDAATAAHSVCRVRVYGSDFAKGTFGMSGSIEAQTEIYSVTPIIFKDHYKINGSDLSQVGWVEGVDANGATSYLWYLKSKSDTMKRWNDYLEMGLIEGESGGAAAAHETRLESNVRDDNSRSTNVVGGNGVAGLFNQIEARGHEFDAFFAGTGPLSNATVSQYENDVEDIILALDEQAGISNYSWFVNRPVSLNIDRWLATKNSFGADNTGAAGTPATASTGETAPGRNASSYYGDGLSVNSAEKMINFGFRGFTWADYNFMKTTWDYLIDPTMRGGMGDITGLMIPMGTTTVKDISGGGNNVARPYVYIGYKTSPIDNRMNKEWITGSVGAYTDDEDAMKCHFLSERTLVVQAANNFVILK